MRTIFHNSYPYSPPATPKGILVSVTGRSHSQTPFRGEHWYFRFLGSAHFFDKALGFCTKKTSVFQFWCLLQFTISVLFRSQVPVYGKNKMGFLDLLLDAV